MDQADLARAVAADLGGGIAIETERKLRGEPLSGDGQRGLTEAAAIASFIVSCAQLAFDIWRARQDRALLQQAILEGASIQPLLDPEKRLSLIGRIIDRLIPDSIGASPSLEARSARSKQEWLTEWLGIGKRRMGVVVLQPFADMDYFIVREPLSWTPSAHIQDIGERVTVPKGFVTDLATIPPIFWWVLPPQGNYGLAAILHDWLYWDQWTARDRERADRIFEIAMEEMGVGLPLRKAMWSAVRIYGGSYWNKAKEERAQKINRVLTELPDRADIKYEDWRRRPNVFAPLV
jgi:hypothetical protein